MNTDAYAKKVKAALHLQTTVDHHWLGGQIKNPISWDGRFRWDGRVTIYFTGMRRAIDALSRLADASSLLELSGYQAQTSEPHWDTPREVNEWRDILRKAGSGSKNKHWSKQLVSGAFGRSNWGIALYVRTSAQHINSELGGAVDARM